jgi:probable aminopeptidase NPEPL1
MVGKGIVYDTGGLSIKVPPNMAGMKNDMGGSAAVLGAFEAAVASNQLQVPLYALLCIAENAVGPLATRPDDVHTLLSGKTVEVNNILLFLSLFIFIFIQLTSCYLILMSLSSLL